MWIVNGKTVGGKEVSYKIPTSKDTDKGHIIGLAYAEHSKGLASDPLDFPSVETVWTADNVQNIPHYQVSEKSNFTVEKRVGKGLWERHSVRALRTIESAKEALEGAASADKAGKYRVVEAYTLTRVVAISKNAKDVVAEEPDPIKPEEFNEAKSSKPATKAA